jgi:hypothetical protein
MVANSQNHHHVEERDDMQHIQTQRLLALRVIAPPKSRLGQLIEERLAQLYDKLGEDLDPAMRNARAKLGGAAQQDRMASNTDTAADSAEAISGPNRGQQTSALALGNNGLAQAQDLGLSQGTAREAERSPSDRAVTARDTAQLQRSRFRQSKATEISQSGQVNWVWMLSQLLQTDLKRLGLEPDEFDDIRVFLIKNEARKFDKLELLSRLPDSLSPEALTKIFEDIRTMAAGYVAFVLVDRTRADLENGEELKQMPHVPRSISGPVFGIPLVDFDPTEALKKLG